MNQRGNRTPTRIDNRTIYTGDKGGRTEPRSNVGVIDQRTLPPGPAPAPDLRRVENKADAIKCPECGAASLIKQTIKDEETGVVIRQCECTNAECKGWNKDKNRGHRFKS